MVSWIELKWNNFNAMKLTAISIRDQRFRFIINESKLNVWFDCEKNDLLLNNNFDLILDSLDSLDARKTNLIIKLL